jgi:hypothetical protein
MSVNAGESWTQAGRGMKAKQAFALAVGPQNDIYAGTNKGVWRSTNQGSEWIQVGLAKASVQSLFINQTGSVFAGTSSDSGGVYRSTDNGATWSHFGLTGQLPQAFVANAQGILFAGIQAGWVWKTLSTTLTWVDGEDVGRPSAFVLEQNYPNPFNPSTRIRFSIPVSREYAAGSMETKLVVYDLLGREVAVLVNEKKVPGQYEVKFDAATLASGIYFYRLTAGGNAQTRKMIVLK